MSGIPAMARCTFMVALVVALASIACYLFFRSEEALLSVHSRIDFRSPFWFHEAIRWDSAHKQFVLSALGGGLAVVNTSQQPPRAHLLLQDPELNAFAFLGFEFDYVRHRVLVVVVDLFSNRYSAVAAYDTRSWKRVFLAKLAGDDRVSLANDVAIDFAGNAFVTDAIGNLIWRVSPDGSHITLTESGEFKLKPRHVLLRTVGLNGIVYHPGGFLLVAHTGGMALFKVSLNGEEVRRVDLQGDFVIGDGIALVRPDCVAMAGLWSGVSLLESKDGWWTAKVTRHYTTPRYRMASSVTVKDERILVNYLVGSGFPYTFTISEVSFDPL